MKNSPKLLLLLTGALALTGSVLQAQAPATPPTAKPDRPENRGPGGPGERGGRRMDPAAALERATKDLGLSADQQAKWKELDQQQQSAMEAIRNDSALSQEDRRAKGAELRKTFGDQRRAILTADQQKKFEEFRNQQRGPGGPGGGPGGPEGRRGRDRQGPPPDAPPPGK